MKASIEDLRKGDTVLISIGSVLSEVKLLRQPQLAKLGKKTTWHGKPRWSSVLCAVRYEEEVITYAGGRTYTRTIPVIADGKEYDREKRVEFTGRICWIINREE